MNSHPASRAFARLRSALGFLAASLFLAVMPIATIAQNAPPGTLITNIGNVYFDIGGATQRSDSNAVTVTVLPTPTTATITIDRYNAGAATSTTAGPTQCLQGNVAVPLPDPVVAGSGSLNPAQPLPLSATGTVHAGDAIFLRVTDGDQNLDATVLDFIDVRVVANATGDSERVRLTETGVNTGVFVGYVPSQTSAAAAGDCVLQVTRDTSLQAFYVDPDDAADAVQAESLIDPFGRLFDSLSGAPVDGARVTLIDVATGLPAAVLGDDGVSSYPATLITGQPVTDSGGTVYVLPAGFYRFPLVAPGQYRLEIEPPAGYLFPSMRTEADLQQLPGNPWRLGPGSFGNSFDALAPPAVAVDVPLDPSGTDLILRKSANTTVAAPGDFVQYQVNVQNASTVGEFRNVLIEDRLPFGLRFRPGSARIDGQPVADPAVSADGRGLTFTVPLLPAGAQATVTYVVEIAAVARGPELVNVAVAEALGGIRSNEARALIRLRNELFTDKGFIAGRVVEAICASPVESAPGVAGVRIYLEDGRYAVTDSEGKYHFEDVPPGTHVVQLDMLSVPDYLQLSGCTDNARFAGRAYSQFAQLRGGQLWRADFRLIERAPARGTAELRMRSRLIDERTAEHELLVHVQGVATGNNRIQLLLPTGLQYESGSAHRDGTPIESVSLRSNVLSVDLHELAAGAQIVVKLRTRVTAAAADLLAIKAILTFDTAAASGQRTAATENSLRFGSAEYRSGSYRFSPRFDVLKTHLSTSDRLELDRIADEWRAATEVRLRAVGHADKTPISAASRKLFADNYQLSQARAQVVADYLMQRLGLESDAVVVDGRGADEPLATGDDPASLARNRRVEIEVTGRHLVRAGELQLVKAVAEPQSIATSGVVLRAPVAATAPRRPAIERSNGAESIPQIEELQPGIDWLLPREDAVPPIPAIKIAIKHGPRQSIELRINGQPVGELNYDGERSNTIKTVSVSRWRGVNLRDGENELVADVLDDTGKLLKRLTRNVHYGSNAVRAELDRSASVLVADGRTKPVIALKLFDAYGKPVRRGSYGSFRVDAPHRSWWEVESLDDNPLLAVAPREPPFEVEEGGIARLELEPTTQAGNVRMHLRLSERQNQDLNVWLAPTSREWIMVGVASGTAAYQQISQNLQNAEAAGVEEGFDSDGRVAFFAKGSIRGDYLLTLAYDSARDREEARQRLLGVIEPGRYYMVYGDGTEQRFESASARKLYLKLERRQFAALFGDYETGFTVTELTRYNRTLNGLKADYGGDRAGFSAFAARTDLGMARDEIRGDGTSGLYRLSRAPIVINSDKIRIEIRDRFETSKVISSSEQSRYLDYTLDYSTGELFFKQPVPSRDDEFNPVFIIAEYETVGTGEERTSAGARVYVKSADERVEVGASYLRDGAANGDSEISGVDLRWRPAASTELRAEFAASQSDDPSRASSASAYLAELKHVTEKLDARVYVREQDVGFGIGQQLSTEEGSRKAGIDARWRLEENLNLQAESYWLQSVATAAERRYAAAELRYGHDGRSAGIGARIADDRMADGEHRQSEQLFLTGSINLFDDRITLRGSGDITVGNQNESVDYPARALVGVDYHLGNLTTAFVEYEHGNGSALDTDMTRIGLRAQPWEHTQVTTSLNQQFTEFGPRLFANFGLTQGWQINDAWSVDFGVDQSNTMRGSALAPLTDGQPLASGTLAEDFFASYVGASYRRDLWTLTSRIEHRSADSEQRWGVLAGWYREPVRGHALSLALTGFDSLLLDGGRNRNGDLQFNWAYRPVSSAWIVYNRLDLRFDATRNLLNDFDSARIVENLHMNWQAGPRDQLGLQVGARYVESTFATERYSGTSTFAAADLRHDISPRFDAGLHLGALNSWQSRLGEYTAGADLGINVARNVWIAIGYNLLGFDDRDFSEARFTAKGPFLRFAVKADQDTFKDLALDRLRPSR
ncbi:MAG: OmpA family protein [Steroidobacteraceae bacterium]